MISLLVAMDRNHVIGYKNDLPWHLPDDLHYFKEKTIGNTIIMGSKTFTAIGRVLPKRRNVILSRSNPKLPGEVEVIHNLETVKRWNNEFPDEEFFIIGGGDIFKQAISFADRLYITWIDEEFTGDVYFPKFSIEKDWILTSKVKGKRDAKNPYDYYYLVYDRSK